MASAPPSKKQKSQMLDDLSSPEPQANMSPEDLEDSLILPENKDVDEKKMLNEDDKKSVPTSIRNVPVSDDLECESFDICDYYLIDAKMKLEVFGNVSKGKVITVGEQDSCETTCHTKESKVPFLDFDKNLEDSEALDEKFAVGMSTVLSEAALEDTKDCIGLPPSKYDGQKLMEMSTKPSFTYSGPQDTKVKQSFIDLEDGSGHDDDDVSIISEQAAGDYNVSAQFPSGPKELLTSSTKSLIQVPDKVEEDNIDCAESEKKIDMQEVKTVMLEVLKSPEDNQASSSSASTSEIRGSVDAASYSKLLDGLSPETRSNMSVPIAFVTLLHLAQEHNLLLENSEDMKSLSVKQLKEP